MKKKVKRVKNRHLGEVLADWDWNDFMAFGAGLTTFTPRKSPKKKRAGKSKP